MENSDNSQDVSPPLLPAKRKRGRPTKEEAYQIEIERRMERRSRQGGHNIPKLGRPKELQSKVQELKQRLLASDDSSKILDRVIKKALDDNDKDQMVAIKLCLDRILPASLFEKTKNDGTRIQVNISTLSATPEPSITTIEMEDGES